ncbi:hypothetical protein [Vitiosangium sp. GDMCC 1.1324]|uniref:hypothetical protein n=1 Tax=Vitiosangium sp. (strain GDMCC 1.1324) TaxID=2138576 RepID=UPI00130E1F94|nr:hypothetical protein [Vitiosangium sp. GDMCC 1.1324]
MKLHEPTGRAKHDGAVGGRIAGPVVAALIYLVPSGLHEVPDMGHRPAVAAWMALWWFTEAVPMTWTAMLPVVLIPALGVFGTGSVLAAVGRSAQPFVDPYTFLTPGCPHEGPLSRSRQVKRKRMRRTKR